MYTHLLLGREKQKIYTMLPVPLFFVLLLGVTVICDEEDEPTEPIKSLADLEKERVDLAETLEEKRVDAGRVKKLYEDYKASGQFKDPFYDEEKYQEAVKVAGFVVESFEKQLELLDQRIQTMQTQSG